MTAFVNTEQLDGSPLAGYNCNVAATRSLLLFAGKAVPSTAVLRRQTGDFAGGTRLDQMAALAARYRVELTIHYGASFEQLWAWLHDPMIGLLISIWYGPVHGTAHDADPAFTGNHAIGGNDGDIADPLADGRRYGIPKGLAKWDKALLKAACGDLNVSNSGYAALGMGKAWCGVVHAPVAPGPAPKPGTVIYRYGGEGRSRGDYRVKAGITAVVRTTPNNTNVSVGQTPPGAVVTRLLGGQRLPFHVSQSTITGAPVDGTRMWHGDAAGKQWINHSVVQAA